MAVSSAIAANFFGVTAASGIVVAAILVGTDGFLGGIPRVDIFHYVLAANQLIYMNAVI